MSSTPAQKKKNQTNTNSKQSKQIVISDRIREGSNDPIKDHNRFGALADYGDMEWKLNKANWDLFHTLCDESLTTTSLSDSTDRIADYFFTY